MNTTVAPKKVSSAPVFYCQECGRPFRTAAAERASSVGCPGCGGCDVDLGKPARG